MIQLREFLPEMQNRVIDFLASVFSESGKFFEPEGRHSSFVDIKKNFIGFWCLFDDEVIIGTVALKKINDEVCELKGLYLFEKYQGLKLGYRLAATAIEFAKIKGFNRIVLDTISTYQKAIRLYNGLGFVSIERYNDNQKADVFMALDL